MRFYTVRRLGRGTIDDPYRPDLPEGVDWIGAEAKGVYMVAVDREIAAAPGRSGSFRHDQMDEHLSERGLSSDQLQVWAVRKSPS